MDYAWNDRGELTGRTKTQPGTPAIVYPTVFRQGFEESVISSNEAFGFDQAGRLTSYLNLITHQYDAHGHRVATVFPAWGTRYQVYSRGGELLYVDDLGAQQRTEFFHLNGTLVAERTRPTSSEAATVDYLHSDHRGSPTVKSAPSGGRVYRSRLKPYGDPYDGIWREGPGFTKHAMDEGGNLVYMQQRYYDPAMGGFLSPDPIRASAQSFSPYWYANNNPYTFVDPDGRVGRLITTLGAGFLEEAAIQYATTGTVNPTQALKGAAESVVNPMKKVERVRDIARAVSKTDVVKPRTAGR
ncbi:MAG: RHS repeat-associated core domain-containing protein [Chiayiivirga sp.]|jgi:RHS repeat-associated protein|uniref:RHS repeat-associated core domain-containing protein n=1 Tax=Chiayiivirga sp. TaxID=2041042 RepID=UPI0025BCF795|nr:RHS repeat-associated core domain-containing protein [Chiayiivirga sp.]MCI1711595.1 RHS repeat-associated core domain-containing protein [Chiayiivirga sp.]MCI1730619.1 RHS repeat-associated core domain-containing protein [Chiayiivirga sp.]